MTRITFAKLESALERLEECGYRADIRCECFSEPASAIVTIRIHPCDTLDLHRADRSGPEVVHFAIRAIEPYLCETIFGEHEIDLQDSTLTFRTEGPQLWKYEDFGEIFCNSAVDPVALFRNVALRMSKIATWDDIFRYLNPLKKQDPPYWLGRFPASLFVHVRDALHEMQVETFVAKEPKPRVPPVILEIRYLLKIEAKDFEVEIRNPENLPDWFDIR